jgi:hypothetical protein
LPRSRHLILESLESRLALAGTPLATLVEVTAAGGDSLVGAETAVEEGRSLVATVQLTRRPAAPVLVSFKSADVLQVTTDLPTLRFTRADWNQPQTIRFSAIEDGSLDGDRSVPVAMRISLPSSSRAEQVVAALRIDAVDSGLVNPLLPVEGTYRGRMSGPDTSGSVSITCANGKGIALFRVHASGSNPTTGRLITAGFEIAADNTVRITALRGIAARNFSWDAAYQSGPDGRGVSGRLTVTQPASNRTTTMLMSATLNTPAAGDPLPGPVAGLRVLGRDRHHGHGGRAVRHGDARRANGGRVGAVARGDVHVDHVPTVEGARPGQGRAAARHRCHVAPGDGNAQPVAGEGRKVNDLRTQGPCNAANVHQDAGQRAVDVGAAHCATCKRRHVGARQINGANAAARLLANEEHAGKRAACNRHVRRIGQRRRSAHAISRAGGARGRADEN